jgi:hypothetical protein
MEEGKNAGFPMWLAGMALWKIAGRFACLNVPSDRYSGLERTGRHFMVCIRSFQFPSKTSCWNSCLGATWEKIFSAGSDGKTGIAGFA